MVSKVIVWYSTVLSLIRKKVNLHFWIADFHGRLCPIQRYFGVEEEELAKWRVSLALAADK